MALIQNALSLGKKMQEARSAKGMTQAELAARVQCARKTIIALEAGANTSTYTLFRALSELGLAVDLQPQRVDLSFLDSLVEPYQ